jgi:Arc-like DNA binding domain
MAQPADAQLKFRVEKRLREQLEHAAQERGVSLNKEIAERLAHSLEDKPAAFDETSPAYGILKLLYAAMDAGGKAALFVKTRAPGDSNWVDDEFAYAIAAANAVEILNALKPRAPKSTSTKVPPSHFDGAYFAEFFLQMVAAGEAKMPEAQPRIDSLRQSLGHLADRIQSFATIDPDERALDRLRTRMKK